MNDFTKEELIALKNGIEYLPDRVNLSSMYQEKCDELITKLKHMINNYEDKKPLNVFMVEEKGRPTKIFDDISDALTYLEGRKREEQDAKLSILNGALSRI